MPYWKHISKPFVRAPSSVAPKREMPGYGKPAALVLAALALALIAPPARGATTSQIWKTAGSYLWLCPTDVTNVQVECWGGGGGGGGAYNNTAVRKGGGGGGGAYAKKINVPVTPGNTYTVVIPAKAAGGGRHQ